MGTRTIQGGLNKDEDDTEGLGNADGLRKKRKKEFLYWRFVSRFTSKLVSGLGITYGYIGIGNIVHRFVVPLYILTRGVDSCFQDTDNAILTLTAQQATLCWIYIIIIITIKFILS